MITLVGTNLEPPMRCITMVQSVLTEEPVGPGHSATKFTYADLELLPDDDLRHEIIDGVHYVTASPVTRHQRISMRLEYLLQSYLETHPAGEIVHAPFDVVLSFTDIVVPDLIFISTQRASLLAVKNLQGAPDLVVEIISPSTRSRDRRLKRDLYERVGVDEYWLVDPERDLVDVQRLGTSGFEPPVRYEKHESLTTPLLPGLDIPLARILS